MVKKVKNHSTGCIWQQALSDLEKKKNIFIAEILLPCQGHVCLSVSCGLLYHCGPTHCQFPQPRCLLGLGGQRHAPAALPPVKIRYPLCGRLDGLQGRSRREGKPRLLRDSIPGSLSLYRVAILTE
jgi:hypothetical protein